MWAEDGPGSDPGFSHKSGRVLNHFFAVPVFQRACQSTEKRSREKRGSKSPSCEMSRMRWSPSTSMVSTDAGVLDEGRNECTARCWHVAELLQLMAAVKLRRSVDTNRSAGMRRNSKGLPSFIHCWRRMRSATSCGCGMSRITISMSSCPELEMAMSPNFNRRSFNF